MKIIWHSEQWHVRPGVMDFILMIHRSGLNVLNKWQIFKNWDTNLKRSPLHCF